MCDFVVEPLGRVPPSPRTLPDSEESSEIQVLNVISTQTELVLQGREAQVGVSVEFSGGLAYSWTRCGAATSQLLPAWRLRLGTSGESRLWDRQAILNELLGDTLTRIMPGDRYLYLYFASCSKVLVISALQTAPHGNLLYFCLGD